MKDSSILSSLSGLANTCMVIANKPMERCGTRITGKKACHGNPTLIVELDTRWTGGCTIVAMGMKSVKRSKIASVL